MMGRQRRQRKFTDIEVLQSWENKPLVPKESFYYALYQADDIFRHKLFLDCYASCGRPSIPPSRLVKILLLQFYEGVSNLQVLLSPLQWLTFTLKNSMALREKLSLFRWVYIATEVRRWIIRFF